MEASNGLNPFLSWDTSVAGAQDEILGLGYANRLNGEVSLIGIFNGTLNITRTLECGPRYLNTLQEAVYNFPYKSITTMDAFNASQQAYRISIAPVGADTNINYFLCATAVMIPKL